MSVFQLSYGLAKPGADELGAPSIFVALRH